MIVHKNIQKLAIGPILLATLMLANCSNVQNTPIDKPNILTI